MNNASVGAYQFQAGANFNGGVCSGLALDAIYSHVDSAVLTSPLSTAALVAKFSASLAATISDNTSIMLLAKYAYGPVKIFGGYEHILFSDPSNHCLHSPTSEDTPYFLPISTIPPTAPPKEFCKYSGPARIATPTIWTSGSYYHYLQNDYAGELLVLHECYSIERALQRNDGRGFVQRRLEIREEV